LERPAGAFSRCKEIKPVDSNEPAKPFWIMNVNGHVVKDHGDIWNANVINLILSIMQPQRGTVNAIRDRLPKTPLQPW
jgi:hypothetical protein